MKITAQGLVRWSGPAVMIAGLSYALVGVLHPPDLASAVTTMPWPTVHIGTMLTTVSTIVIHTPVWVWVLYAVLLLLGFQRTRDGTVPLFRVLTLPLIVALLAIATFIGGGMSGLPAMIVGLTVGSAVGWQLEREGATRRLAGGRVWLRGDWWSFVQLVMVLIFRYATSAAGAMDPALNADLVWHLTTLGISAGLSGLLLGRAAARLRVYFRSAPAAA